MLGIILSLIGCAHHITPVAHESSEQWGHIDGTKCRTIVEVAFASLPDNVSSVYLQVTGEDYDKRYTALNGLIENGMISNALCFDQSLNTLTRPVTVRLVFDEPGTMNTKWAYITLVHWTSGTTRTWLFDHVLIEERVNGNKILMMDYPAVLTITVTTTYPTPESESTQN